MRRQIPEDQPSKGGWSGTEGAADLEIRSPGYGPSSALPQCMTLHSPVALTCKMKDGQDSPLEHSDLELMCQCGTGDPTEHPPVDSRSCFGASEKELCRAVKNRALRGFFFFFSFLSFFRTSSQCPLEPGSYFFVVQEGVQEEQSKETKLNVHKNVPKE